MAESVIPGAETLPTDLLEAFTAYERAIMANDLDVLDAAFAPGEGTMRGDAAGLLVGHDAISAFRGVRGGVPPRVIERIEHRELAPDVALLVSVSRFAGGGTGLQTQLWERIDGRWLITAAHVTPARAGARPVRVAHGRRPALAGRVGRRRSPDSLSRSKICSRSRATASVRATPRSSPKRAPRPTTAAAVTDLLRGGASLRGIARTDEFAYSIAGDNVHYGTPPNGALPGALPGGSSSGPASAVATGQAEIGLATDTAGSMRVPASYQGLWGLRTTHGLVPRQGLLPLAQSFDTIGWLTRDGATLQRVVDWCLSYDGSESTENVFGESDDDLPWRFVVPTEVLDAVEPETRAAFDALQATLTSSPDAAPVDFVSIGDLDEYFVPFRTVQGAEAWRNNGEWVTAHPDAWARPSQSGSGAASVITAEQEAAARRAARAPRRAPPRPGRRRGAAHADRARTRADAHRCRRARRTPCASRRCG